MNQDQDLHFTLEIGFKGRVTLPAELRKRANLKDGDKLVITLKENHQLELKSGQAVAKHGRGILHDMLPETKGKKLVDELLAERRKEAKRE